MGGIEGVVGWSEVVKKRQMHRHKNETENIELHISTQTQRSVGVSCLK